MTVTNKTMTFILLSNRKLCAISGAILDSWATLDPMGQTAKYFVISGWHMSAQAIVPIAAVARWAAQGAAGATVVPPLQAL